MKFRFFFLSLAIWWWASSLSAQGIVASGKMGLHFPDIVDGQNQWSFDSKVGVHAGIGLMVYSSDLFALQTEFTLASIKTSGNRLLGHTGPDTTRQNLDFDLQYAEIPLLGRFSFGNAFRASVYAGSTIGLLIHREASFSSVTTLADGGSQSEVRPVEDLLHDFNLSMTLGAAVEFRNVFVEFRYHWGLTDLYGVEETPLKLRNLYLSGGYVLYF